MRKQSVYAVAVASMIATGAAMGRHETGRSNGNHQAFNRRQLSYIGLEQPGSGTYTGPSWSWKQGYAIHAMYGTDLSGRSQGSAFLRQPSTSLLRSAPSVQLQGTLTVQLASLRIAPPPPHPARPHRHPTQPAPAPAQPVANPRTSQPPPATEPAPPAGGAWAALRQCESGGNYSADTGNGYYGAYQFTLSTWYSLGETGLPSQAPPAVQDAAAKALQSRAGWGQWPVCSQQLGL
ncbi:MAG: transglycosylase family protein [Actinobacteria bacterium]|jgi:hypothetical protein|nr:transglycosylase family protein [Actinomycetota bacterium]